MQIWSYEISAFSETDSGALRPHLVRKFMLCVVNHSLHLQFRFSLRCNRGWLQHSSFEQSGNILGRSRHKTWLSNGRIFNSLLPAASVFSAVKMPQYNKADRMRCQNIRRVGQGLNREFQIQQKVRQGFNIHDPFGSAVFRIEVW